MTVSYWQQSAANEPRRFDYIVVGGGIVGVSAAYWYHKMHPDHSVAIIEARSLASGASGRNAGFILQGTATDFLTDIERYGSDVAGRVYRLTCRNRDLIESELSHETIGFRATGSIIAAATKEEDERLIASVGPVRAAGGRVIHLTKDETARRLQSQGFFGSLLVSTGATVNPVRLLHEVARKSKATVVENRVVDAIDNSGDLTVVRVGSQSYEAPAVTVATNAYLPQLFPSLSRYVRPVRAQMLSTEPVSSITLGYPVYSHHGYYYLRQTDNGNLLVGGARHLHKEQEVGYDDQTTVELQADLIKYLKDHFPSAGSPRILNRWSGVMGFSPDGLPSIGKLPGLTGPNYWAAGFTGHGMSIGFLIGHTLAQLATGKEGILEMDILSSDRISDKTDGSTIEDENHAASTLR